MRTIFEEQLAFWKEDPAALSLVSSDPFTHDHAALIGSLTTSSRLPGIYAFARFAHNGGLVAYGIDLDEQLPKGSSNGAVWDMRGDVASLRLAALHVELCDTAAAVRTQRL
jgi:hypothetical protein